jgi:hypothetical protein
MPLVVSPKIGHRLLFASNINFSMAATALLLALSVSWRWRGLCLAVALSVNAAHFWLAYLGYSTYAGQFEDRASAIAVQRIAGAEQVTMPYYTINFRPWRKYLRKEACISDPDHRLNKLKARYFGVKSLVMKCP